MEGRDGDADQGITTRTSHRIFPAAQVGRQQGGPYTLRDLVPGNRAEQCEQELDSRSEDAPPRG
jgi:hypothetical protein